MCTLFLIGQKTQVIKEHNPKMFYLNCLLFHISRNVKLNKQTTKPAAITATTIRAVLSPSPLTAACSLGRPVPKSFPVGFSSSVAKPIPVVASVLLVVISLVVLVVVGGLAVLIDVPRVVVVVVVVVVAAVVASAVVVVVVEAAAVEAEVAAVDAAAVTALVVVVVPCAVVDRFRFVVAGCWVTFKGMIIDS